MTLASRILKKSEGMNAGALTKSRSNVLVNDDSVYITLNSSTNLQDEINKMTAATLVKFKREAIGRYIAGNITQSEIDVVEAATTKLQAKLVKEIEAIEADYQKKILAKVGGVVKDLESTWKKVLKV